MVALFMGQGNLGPDLVQGESATFLTALGFSESGLGEGPLPQDEILATSKPDIMRSQIPDVGLHGQLRGINNKQRHQHEGAGLRSVEKDSAISAEQAQHMVSFRPSHAQDVRRLFEIQIDLHLILQVVGHISDPHAFLCSFGRLGFPGNDKRLCLILITNNVLLKLRAINCLENMRFPFGFVKKSFTLSENRNFGPLIPREVIIEELLAEVLLGLSDLTEVREN